MRCKCLPSLKFLANFRSERWYLRAKWNFECDSYFLAIKLTKPSFFFQVSKFPFLISCSLRLSMIWQQSSLACTDWRIALCEWCSKWKKVQKFEKCEYSNEMKLIREKRTKSHHKPISLQEPGECWHWAITGNSAFGLIANFPQEPQKKLPNQPKRGVSVDSDKDSSA